IDFSELSIMRRLHRGGEGQYLVNRASVRRLDLVELLADLGLGADGRSIVGQGRVEEILASRPEGRRAVIEGAARPGRLQARRREPPRRAAGEGARRLLERRGRARDELADAAGRREAAAAAPYRRRGGGERLALRSEAVEALLEDVLAAADESQRAEAQPAGPS